MMSSFYISLYSKAHAAAKALIDIESVSSFAAGISCSKAMALQALQGRKFRVCRNVLLLKHAGLTAIAVSSSQ
jgi:hypothetical protein